MKRIILPILTCALLLAWLPVLAAKPANAAARGESVIVAASDDFAAKKDEYERKAEAQYEEFQQNM
ncbi:MAG TPA: hypothetical protein VEK12_09955, partial [Alphaproteobacteria bacterium]|nr:hypothetical protein [Alphaproteobacteria bacterium]